MEEEKDGEDKDEVMKERERKGKKEYSDKE